MATWESRIVGEGEESPAKLLANPLNFRAHPEAQQEAMEGILDEVGWVQRVIVNRITGHIVDGHMRVALAAKHGEKSVPVVYVELSETEEAKVLSVLDPIAAMATTDGRKLDALLRNVSTGSAALQELLAKQFEQSKRLMRDVASLVPDGQAKGTPASNAPSAEREETDRFPLAIVLTATESRLWRQFKETNEVKSDKDAFVLMLDLCSDTATEDDDD